MICSSTLVLAAESGGVSSLFYAAPDRSPNLPCCTPLTNSAGWPIWLLFMFP